MRYASALLLAFFFAVASSVLAPSVHAQPVKNSAWDSSVEQVESYLEENLKDPDSYEAIEWYEVQRIQGKDGEPKYVTRHKYRAKNSFGGYVVSDEVFVFDRNGEYLTHVDYDVWERMSD